MDNYDRCHDFLDYISPFILCIHVLTKGYNMPEHNQLNYLHVGVFYPLNRKAEQNGVPQYGSNPTHELRFEEHAGDIT